MQACIQHHIRNICTFVRLYAIFCQWSVGLWAVVGLFCKLEAGGGGGVRCTQMRQGQAQQINIIGT